MIIYNKCTKCECQYDITDFPKINMIGSKQKNFCSKCLLEVKNKILLRKNSEREYRKKYYQENKELFKEYRKKYYQENKELFKDYNKIHSERIKIIKKTYRENNKEKIKILKKNHCERNKERLYLYRKEYYKKNSARILERVRTFNRNNNHIVSWRTILKSHLRRIGTKKENKTSEILDYSAIDLKNHIESLFKEGMSWDNREKWHIDHIRPISNFPKDTSPNIVNALSNLQPLWKTENLKKFNKYETSDTLPKH